MVVPCSLRKHPETFCWTLFILKWEHWASENKRYHRSGLPDPQGLCSQNAGCPHQLCARPFRLAGWFQRRSADASVLGTARAGPALARLLTWPRQNERALLCSTGLFESPKG